MASAICIKRLKPFDSGLAVREGANSLRFPNPPLNPIEPFVAQILAAKQANPQADVRPLEAEIDRLVYQLYGLTDEEIAIIEAGV